MSLQRAKSKSQDLPLRLESFAAWTGIYIYIYIAYKYEAILEIMHPLEYCVIVGRI